MPAFPRDLLPMLATAGTAFDSPDFTFEIKWDGVRALAYKDGDRFWLETRNRKPALPRFPELGGIAAVVAARRVILDGEIVVFSPNGRPDFDAVRARNAQRNPSAIAEARRTHPAVFIAFDCLFRDERNLLDQPLAARLEHLAHVVAPGDVIAAPQGVREHGRSLFAAAAAKGLEGIVAKALASPYRPGKRSPDWIKVRNVHNADCVVGGFVPDGSHSVASLLLGLYDAAQRLVYMGHVGTGFTAADRRHLRTMLDARGATSSPFAAVARAEAKGAVWVQPELVAAVEFLTLTGAGHLRHPTYRGLREDKPPPACLIETELPPHLPP